MAEFYKKIKDQYEQENNFSFEEDDWKSFEKYEANAKGNDRFSIIRKIGLGLVLSIGITMILLNFGPGFTSSDSLSQLETTEKGSGEISGESLGEMENTSLNNHQLNTGKSNQVGFNSKNRNEQEKAYTSPDTKKMDNGISIVENGFQVEQQTVSDNRKQDMIKEPSINTQAEAKNGLKNTKAEKLENTKDLKPEMRTDQSLGQSSLKQNQENNTKSTAENILSPIDNNNDPIEGFDTNKFSNQIETKDLLEKSDEPNNQAVDKSDKKIAQQHNQTKIIERLKNKLKEVVSMRGEIRKPINSINSQLKTLTEIDSNKENKKSVGDKLKGLSVYGSYNYGMASGTENDDKIDYDPTNGWEAGLGYDLTPKINLKLGYGQSLGLIESERTLNHMPQSIPMTILPSGALIRSLEYEQEEQYIGININYSAIKLFGITVYAGFEGRYSRTSYGDIEYDYTLNNISQTLETESSYKQNSFLVGPTLGLDYDIYKSIGVYLDASYLLRLDKNNGAVPNENLLNLSAGLKYTF